MESLFPFLFVTFFSNLLVISISKIANTFNFLFDEMKILVDVNFLPN